MGWVQLLVLLLSAVEKLTHYAEQKQLLDAGQARQAADSLARSNLAMRRMVAAGDAERRRIQRDGLQLDHPDPDRRD